jgi:acyl transferase domain-containing protein
MYFKIKLGPSLGVYKTEPIAIVGMSCRYPGANNLEEFWKILINGEDQMHPIPDNRWTLEDGIETTPDERNIPAGYLKCAVDEFDAKFFGMSPLELSYLDPQQRLLLEVAWESIEDAGT